MPSPSEQYYQITKDVETLERSDWAAEGSSVMINHLLAVTGDPRNSIRVSEMKHEGKRHCGTVCMCVFGGIFAILPLFIAMIIGCGAKMLVWAPILFGVPACIWFGCSQQQEKKQAKPDGQMLKVNEQGMTIAMTGPIPPNDMTMNPAMSGMNPGMMQGQQQQPGMATATAMPMQGFATATAVPMVATATAVPVQQPMVSTVVAVAGL